MSINDKNCCIQFFRYLALLKLVWEHCVRYIHFFTVFVNYPILGSCCWTRKLIGIPTFVCFPAFFLYDDHQFLWRVDMFPLIYYVWWSPVPMKSWYVSPHLICMMITSSYEKLICFPAFNMYDDHQLLWRIDMFPCIYYVWWSPVPMKSWYVSPHLICMMITSSYEELICFPAFIMYDDHQFLKNVDMCSSKWLYVIAICPYE